MSNLTTFQSIKNSRREKVTRKVKSAVLSVYPEAEVILFGSKARGNDRRDSDWDFLVLTSEEIDEKIKRMIRKKLLAVELEIEEVISSIFFSKSDWENYEITPLYQNIQAEGEVL